MLSLLPRSASARVTVGVAVGVIGVNAYRAWSQGITYDEAITYLTFVIGPFERVFLWYTANNHVLFTLAADVTTFVFGDTAFTLRLPAVLASILYVRCAWIVAGRISGDATLVMLTRLALLLHPLIFDFMSAARGYGMALALLMAALAEVTRPPGTRRWVLASLALGGAVCANLAFLFPVAAILGVTSLLAWRFEQPATTVSTLLSRFVLPGAVGAAAFMVVPLRAVTKSDFFFGVATLSGTVRSLVRVTVQHHPTWWNATVHAGWVEHALIVIVPTLAVAAACVLAFSVIVRPALLAEGHKRVAMQSIAVLLTTVGLQVVANAVAGVLYPRERTGLFFVALFIVVVASLGEFARSLGLRRAITGVQALLVLLALEQFTVQSYAEWRYDAGSERVSEFIADWADNHATEPQVATAPYSYYPALEFYRVTRFLGKYPPLFEALEPGDHDRADLLVLAPSEAARLDENETWTTVYRDPVSHAHVLAREPQASDHLSERADDTVGMERRETIGAR